MMVNRVIVKYINVKINFDTLIHFDLNVLKKLFFFKEKSRFYFKYNFFDIEFCIVGLKVLFLKEKKKEQYYQIEQLFKLI